MKIEIKKKKKRKSNRRKKIDGFKLNENYEMQKM
jgi:hypothetical protein